MMSFFRLPRVVFSVSVVALLGSLPVSALAQVTIDMVTVGNAGNANDTTGYGGVPYEYKIGKYEVTVGQYTAFLNAVAASDTYDLYNTSMSSNLNVAGISRTGSTGLYTYSVMNNGGSSGNRPIAYVNWFDAARFANWMQNGQPTGPQSSLTTETGAYTLNGFTSGVALAKNPGAQFYIPTENEWYKAAYASPLLGGGGGGYYTYPTKSTVQWQANLVGSGTNRGNLRIGRYATTQSPTYSGTQNYLTDVGAYTGSGSYYGTFDQGGGLGEMFALSDAASSDIGTRGGYWDDGASAAYSGNRYGYMGPGNEADYLGFRLAAPVAVPEPSTYAMALAGLACGGWHVLRTRRNRTVNNLRWSLIALLLVTYSFMAGAAYAAPIAIDWVTVGDAGNAPDTTGYGAVANSFQIMKYEFTNQQYVNFLNSVAATDTYSLYNTNMGTNDRGGISRSGVSGSYTYAVKTNMGDKPVNYVNWFSAARASNWLMNGATGTSSTETGAYTLSGSISGNAPAVNPGATFYIPTENQWVKAAFNKGGSTNAGYWAYATQSNTAPTAVTADSTGNGSAGSAGNFANYSDGADWNGQNGNVTTVGTSGNASAYGAFDMSGSVWEWNDLTGALGNLRGVRGGGFASGEVVLHSSFRLTENPAFSDSGSGFRLAAVPEPSTCFSLAAGLVFGGWNVLRRRRAH